MEYNFREVETQWQKYWREHQTYKTEINDKPKCFVLDMFPYPSGAGLHVGHPLGYIASDIYSRYKRLKGFNVLHPMGYDSFGLPAEQYAIQTGQHPAITTENNIARYREQLDKIGFSFDWSREVRTSDPSYYKWTQWIFIQLFHSWYDNNASKARSIDSLISIFNKEGNKNVNAVTDEVNVFSADEWKSYNEEQQQYILLNYRLAYLADMWVNWCPALGTVLANEEVKDGVSERGGYPVERKQMKQWCLRITAYAERLLNDLNDIDWPESIKEAQRNWIGKSEGAYVEFKILNSKLEIGVFTTRPDTIFGVSFLTIAPEHELVDIITTADQKKAVDDYVHYAKNRSERERMSEVKKITGVFSGAYALHPFTGDKIPVWIGEYVLAGYGTGAVMAVPAGDQRDWDFAKHFNLPIPAINKDIDISLAADPTKEAIMINSDFLNGMTGYEAIKAAIKEIEKRGFGKGRINYRLRDAIFGRQRYWGEPIPVYYKNNIPYTLSEDELPLVLPEVDKYLPTEDGEPPLARATDWKYYEKSLTPNPSPFERGEIESSRSHPSFKTADVKDWERAKADSRELRKESTPAESVIWEEVRNNKLGYKFRRQHVILNYIVDFVCLEKNLIVEIDGTVHHGNEEYDEQRTNHLRKKGYTVIRFTNDEVLNNTKDVVNKISSTLNEIISPLMGRGARGEAEGWPLETTTMPGWAGSSWYFLRYMDPKNDNEFASEDALDYWQNVDLYIGGAEHATGHLLYVRFWTKFLFDLGYISVEEPAKKLINQGMIQGVSQKIFFSGHQIREKEVATALSDSYYYFTNGNWEQIQDIGEVKLIFISAGKVDSYPERFSAQQNVDINWVNEKNELDINSYNERRGGYKDAIFICEEGYWYNGKFYGTTSSVFLTKPEVEKMSKSKWNVVNPDQIIEDYGADCLRMYEMFLGPLEQSKPWNTNGISGVSNFLRKLWRLYHSKEYIFAVSDEAPSAAELKSLHKTIKKAEEDIERFSFNTSVSTFMICVNELTDLKCNKRGILEPLTIVLSPYAPHITEELWKLLGHTESITKATFPQWKEEFLVEDNYEYPVSVNGKTRFKLNIPLTLSKEEIEKRVLDSEEMTKYLNGDKPKKVIVVPGRIVNIVV